MPSDCAVTAQPSPLFFGQVIHNLEVYTKPGTKASACEELRLRQMTRPSGAAGEAGSSVLPSISELGGTNF